MRTLWQDVRYGLRMMWKTPGFTVVTVLTLAIGIGANSAIFSVANALVLEPFPFENLDSLVAVRESLPNQGLKAIGVSPADFNDWKNQNSVFQEIAAYRMRDTTLIGEGEPELIRGTFVTSDFFTALKTTTVKGRTFLPDDDKADNNQVVVIGYGLWQRRYAADANIVGKTITVNGSAAIVIGIAQSNFDFPAGTEIWMPLTLTPQQLIQRDTHNLQVLAHLKPDMTIVQAQAEMNALAKRIEQQFPQTNTSLSVNVIPLKDIQGEFTKPLLSLLLGMAGFLLLMACVNVANLLFARVTTRQKEIAIRTALGANRLRLMRQLITESLLLSFLAAALGLMLATWAVELIKGMLPLDIAKHIYGWIDMRVDNSVILFTSGVAILTTIVFSLLPVLQASRLDVNATLKEEVSSGLRSQGNRSSSFLIVLEMAFALILLVGAGLMIKGFWQVLNTYEGTNPDSILTLQTPLPELKYKDQQKIVEFYQRTIEQMKTLPDVQSVSIASNTPLNNSPNPSVELIIEGHDALLRGERQLADLLVISPDYFNSIGARLIKGRDFNESDDIKVQPVAIISEITARRYFPNEEPLGKRIKRVGSNADEQWFTVIGIVKDIKQGWFDREIRPQLYLSYLQAPRPKMTFFLQTRTDPMNLVTAARSQIYVVDKDQPIDEIKTLARLFVDETSPFRFAAILMLVFGAIALVLSAVGVYSVMSYSVAQRTKEIGIRVALGAQRKDVLSLIMGQGVKTSVIGLAVGLPLAYALSRFMASVLFGVVSLEYIILLVFISVLVVVALLASFIPAYRATKIDPLSSLKN